MQRCTRARIWWRRVGPSWNRFRRCGVRQSSISPTTPPGRGDAQCWMPFGQRRQICCEQIEITASDAALHDLEPVVLPLGVADLPVVIWSRSPRLVAMPEFRSIASMATKVVLDGNGMAAADAFRAASAV